MAFHSLGDWKGVGYKVRELHFHTKPLGRRFEGFCHRAAVVDVATYSQVSKVCSAKIVKRGLSSWKNKSTKYGLALVIQSGLCPSLPELSCWAYHQHKCMSLYITCVSSFARTVESGRCTFSLLLQQISCPCQNWHNFMEGHGISFVVLLFFALLL